MKKLIRDVIRTLFLLGGIIGTLLSTNHFLLWSDEHPIPYVIFIAGGILAMWPLYPTILMETAMWVARRACHDAPVAYYDKHIRFWLWAKESLAPALLTKAEIRKIYADERRQWRIQQEAHEKGWI